MIQTRERGRRRKDKSALGPRGTEDRKSNKRAGVSEVRMKDTHVMRFMDQRVRGAIECLED